jgi:hypothetical protein
LGAGTITTCGDDLAMYVQLLFAGYQLVYEPTAFLQHIHRREYAALQKQIYNYGVGFTAFLTKTMLDNPARVPGFVVRIPYGLYLLFNPKSFKNKKKELDYPADLNGLEVQGMLRGSLAYLKSRRKARSLLRQRMLEVCSKIKLNFIRNFRGMNDALSRDAYQVERTICQIRISRKANKSGMAPIRETRCQLEYGKSRLIVTSRPISSSSRVKTAISCR